MSALLRHLQLRHSVLGGDSRRPGFDQYGYPEPGTSRKSDSRPVRRRSDDNTHDALDGRSDETNEG